ncbi:hypothetical protein AVT69_gp265 [Pseudomonas phage PhiPA3]|uniref:Uncharacterized protein 267 n=1 Tax=Pseudomonas phage PhiPA3 TaxID=998086 RepID=F8SJA5_BPPA3|nr:hypothetical protein AVT69_gp265 [Pseudomonas phage PhiPA3]AEH03690.1 hypothetical protein [Pseudomonas phage PhiPA3]
MIYIGVIDWKKFTFFCAELKTPQISKFVAEKGSDLYKAFDQFIRDNIEWIPQTAYNRETQVIVRVSCRPNDVIESSYNYIVNSDLYGYKGRGVVTENPALAMVERFTERMEESFEVKLVDEANPYLFGLDLAWRPEAQECIIRYTATLNIEKAWVFRATVYNQAIPENENAPFAMLRKKELGAPDTDWEDVRELTEAEFNEEFASPTSGEVDRVIDDIPAEIRPEDVNPK